MNPVHTSPVRILTLIALALAFLLGAKILAEYRHIGALEHAVQLEDSRVIRQLITAYQKTYLDIFIHQNITPNEQNLEFLPLVAVKNISRNLAGMTGERIKVRMVSERPRDPDNAADPTERRAIEYFRRHPKAAEFNEVEKDNGQEVFFHASPLRITASCLPCHASRKEAPAVIASGYDTGFDYKLGDLYGILSIRLSHDRLSDRGFSSFFLKAAGSTLLLGLLFLGGGLVLLRRIRRDEENYTRELEQVVSSRTASLREKVKLLDEYRKVLDESAIVSKSDLAGNITYVNDRLCRMTGYSRGELLGRPHSILRHPDVSPELFADMWQTISSGRVWRGVFPSRCKDGSPRWNATTICPIFDHSGAIIEYIAARYDVTELIEKRQQLQRLLTTDTLTGLPNRYQLLQDIGRLGKASLLMVDIYNFGEINDFYGIETGDLVIGELARLVARLCRGDDMTLYRLHGDQLAILYQGGWGVDGLERFSHELLEEVARQPFRVNGNEILVQVTCGISFQQENPLIEADLALKQAKRSGRLVQVIVESDDIRQVLRKNHDWLRRLRKALDEDRIVPFYQPIIDAATGRIAKYECLVRLIDEDGTVVPPMDFLPVARKARIYPRITRAVIDHAVQVFTDRSCDFSINLVSEDLMDLGLVEYVHEKLLRTPLAGRVIFEILETEGMENFSRIQEFIREVKRYGCHIAIDDFGAGYSNFERLLTLQADYLKIDGSIIRMITSDEVSATIARTIVTVAGKIGIRTVAEYVHDRQTAELAREIGIDYLQGFHLGEPRPRDMMPEEGTGIDG